MTAAHGGPGEVVPLPLVDGARDEHTSHTVILRIGDALAAGPAPRHRQLAIGADDQPGGELGLAAVDGDGERRPAVARELGRFGRTDGGGALRFCPGKGRFLEPRVQEPHAGDVAGAGCSQTVSTGCPFS